MAWARRLLPESGVHAICCDMFFRRQPGLPRLERQALQSRAPSCALTLDGSWPWAVVGFLLGLPAFAPVPALSRGALRASRQSRRLGPPTPTAMCGHRAGWPPRWSSS
eukprot:2775545-Rhodomonas_salina.1